MNIIMIRHGETDWNLEGRWQGREDIPLNSTGFAQARALGGALSNGFHFGAVITSPLSRARQTAEIIAEILKVPSLIVDDDLMERDLGSASGMTAGMWHEAYPDGNDADMEPWQALTDRMMSAFERAVERWQGCDIVMVSHGASINALITSLSGGEFGRGKTRFQNASIQHIVYQAGKAKILRLNVGPERFGESCEMDAQAGEGKGGRP